MKTLINNPSRKVLPILLYLLLGHPSTAWALQSHGYVGLYVHQGAHLLFLGAMIGFALRLRASELTAQPGWRRMALGAWFFGVWNIWAFIGHFITLTIPDHNVVVLEGDLVPSLLMATWKELTYYVLRMDHLLSLPAIIFFYLGIRAIRETFPHRYPVQERRRQDESRKLDRRII
jgi:hypothetical protein